MFSSSASCNENVSSLDFNDTDVENVSSLDFTMLLVIGCGSLTALWRWCPSLQVCLCSLSLCFGTKHSYPRCSVGIVVYELFVPAESGAFRRAELLAFRARAACLCRRRPRALGPPAAHRLNEGYILM